VARITLAGESLIAQKQGAKEVLHITRFIYANVPGLDPAKPIDRAAAKPPAAQIVHTYEIPAENSGYVNPNQVVYSSMLGSDIGDFDWNWLGLESAEGVLFAVAYLPLQQKRRNIPPVQIGNNVTRNILVEYNGAQELTGISIDASTWQHDFTVRLAGIDERERLSNRDVYGRACFFNEALQVIGTPATGYQVKAGTAYVEGIRLDAQAASIMPPALPTTAWLDVVLERQLSDVVARWAVVFGGTNAFGDWKDALGVKHYCVPLADLSAAGVVDRRGVEVIDGPLVKHFASARSVAEVRQRVSDLEDGTTPAGKAHRWASARRVAFLGDATGQADIDGSINVGIRLTLADLGVTPGAWAKPVVNAKGQVIGSELLLPSDIPALDWSKINSGKPTTLAGYGITDALHTGYSDQVPRFYSPVPGSTYQTPALEIREAGLIGDASGAFEYAPRLGFHWGTVTAGTLAMTSNGILCWNGNVIWNEDNFNPNSKANKATTLAGYGITDAIRRGEVGLGSSTAPVSPIDSPGLPGGFHAFTDGPTSLVNYCSVLVMPYAAGTYSAQLAFQQGGPNVRMLARSTKNDGSWTPTVELFHTGNLNPEVILPVGSLVTSFSRTAPPGCLRTNGAAVSRTTFSRLFAQIGTLFGAGDGVNTFNLPDTRGLFIRDMDDGRGFDVGRVQSTLQYSQNQSHNHYAVTGENGWHYHPGSSVSIGESGTHPHTLRMGSNDVAGIYPDLVAPGGGPVRSIQAVDPGGNHVHSASLVMLGDGVHAHTVTVDPSGGNESRPVNMALYTYIKY